MNYLNSSMEAETQIGFKKPMIYRGYIKNKIKIPTDFFTENDKLILWKFKGPIKAKTILKKEKKTETHTT